ncbi:MAG: RNA methyltransferase [Clostridia bacterium]
MIIESTKNEAVKRARALANKKDRHETGLHFIEGEKLVREAVVSGAEFSEAFLEEGHDMMAAVLEGSGASVYIVRRNVLESITNTKTPQWICASVKTPVYNIPEYFSPGLLVVLDAIQDPGNLGTVIRTADAFGAIGVVLGNGCADPFSPKTLRASMGSVYHIPIYNEKLIPTLMHLKEQDFDLICGHLKGSSEWKKPKGHTALVIGNESNGVSDEIAELCYLYKLPMQGFAESLNASVAAGILIYELARDIQ